MAFMLETRGLTNLTNPDGSIRGARVTFQLPLA